MSKWFSVLNGAPEKYDSGMKTPSLIRFLKHGTELIIELPSSDIHDLRGHILLDGHLLPTLCINHVLHQFFYMLRVLFKHGSNSACILSPEVMRGHLDLGFSLVMVCPILLSVAG